MPVRRTTIGTTAAIAAAIAIATPYIQKFEGLKHTTYPDVGGILTICNGHTGPDVRVNTYYTSDQCYAITQKDETTVATAALKVTPGLKDKPEILASAISFSYNVGPGAYSRSSVARDFNKGDYKAGCADMLKYTYADGKYSKGLANRRQQEYIMCVKGINDASTSSKSSK